MATYLQKLGIYWIIFLIGIFSRLFSSFIKTLPEILISVFGLVFVYLPLAIYFWFLFVVYRDAQEIGVNENWWVAVLLLGPIGATIYYLKTKDQRK